jgi:hypothetical protein
MMMASTVKFVFVTCAECGAEVDRIEYDTEPTSPAVQQVMAALDVDEKTAVSLVKKNNEGAELTSEQQSRALAQAIVDRSVPDRDAETYACPLGHDGELKVTDDNPTPVVSTRLEKEAAK